MSDRLGSSAAVAAAAADDATCGELYCYANGFEEDAVLNEEEEEEDDEINEEEEEDYMRLDTIVEEDESANFAPVCVSQADSITATHLSTTAATAAGSQSVETMRPHRADDNAKSNSISGGSESSSSIIGCSTAASQLNLEQQQTPTKQAMTQQQQQTLLLPSTNRLISEHQARQQQTLFRALAERQKLLDELGPNERRQASSDLMSFSTATLARMRQRQRHKHPSTSHRRSSQGARRQQVSSSSNSSNNNEERCDIRAGGVPLSSVDLSSMPDRMLDELLGHIASASSGSSCGSSSGGASSSASSSVDELSSSSSTDEDDDDDDQCQDSSKTQAAAPTLRHPSAERTAAAMPNVIGVHGDETTSGVGRQRRLASSCQSAARPRATNDNDDDDDDDEQRRRKPPHQSLSVRVGAQPASSGQQEPTGGQSSLERIVGGVGSGSSSLSSLLSPVELASGGSSRAAPARATSADDSSGEQTVETVLGRMLDAIKGAVSTGSAPASQPASGSAGGEHLNELLERGFVHLEKLLNYSLTSSSTPAVPPHPSSQQQRAPTRPDQTTPDGLLQKAGLQPQTSVSLSKDSDYGSDTQSADCFSAQSSANLPATDAAQQTLSPVAIELSLRLAESLRQLAQQHQTKQRSCAVAKPIESSSSPEVVLATNEPIATAAATATTNKRAPMRTVVHINGAGCETRPNSASSVTLNRSRSTTPAAESQQQQQQQQLSSRNPTPTSASFKTCVNIGGSTEIVAPSLACAQASKQEQVSCERAQEETNQQQQVSIVAERLASFRRRRSTRSLSRRGATGASRPGSPLPRLACDEPPISQASTISMANGSSAITSCDPSTRHQQSANKDHSPELDSTTTTTTTTLDDGSKRERRLQRALILAQKYNYSPAKLAASKLGEQLASSSTATQPGKPLSAAQSDQPSCNQVDATRNVCQRNPLHTFAGQIELDIAYFAQTGSLTVHVIRCAQLQPANKRRTTSNPYVKLYLLPDKSKSGKRKSAVKKHSLEPRFDEKFTFGPLQLRDFDQKLLWICVLHKADSRLAAVSGSRNELIGELFLPLAQVRHQLLTSDLCQSTSAKLYNLSAILRRQTCVAGNAGTTKSADSNLNNNKIKQPLIGQQNTDCALAKQPQSSSTQSDQTNEPTKRLPAQHSNQHRLDAGNSIGPVPTAVAPKAQQLVDKLTELERKAARLSSCAMLAAPPDGLRPSLDLASSFGRLSGESQYESQCQSSQAPPTTMQVCLGPLPAEDSPADQISGQLFVALKFVPENTGGETLARRSDRMEGTLHVLIKEARNIGGFEAPPIVRGTSSSDNNTSEKSHTHSTSLPNPFCKCYLLNSSGARTARQRTPQLKRTSNPRWDFECKFGQLKLSQLQAQAVEIHLFNRDSILVKNNESLGAIRLCQSQPTNASDNLKQDTHRSDRFEPLSSERESRLWTQLLARPNIWVYGELPLRQLRPLIALEQLQTATNGS